MADKTIIAWTDHTWNAVWGCAKISPGCKNCYAETLSGRYGHNCWGSNPRRTFGEKHWAEPVKWNRQAEAERKRHKVFCGSMMDWAEDHPDLQAVRPQLWDLIRRTPWLDWQLLTKRADRIAECLPGDWGDGWDNVWLGVSIESNDYVGRADHLRIIPATVRFISYEPALGPVPDMDLTGIDWLICGGESGRGYRPWDDQWAVDVEAKCREFKTAFFFKQSAAIRTEMGTELRGRTVREYPVRRAVGRGSFASLF